MSLRPKEGQSAAPHIAEPSTPTREQPRWLCSLLSCRGEGGGGGTDGGRGAGGLR